MTLVNVLALLFVSVLMKSAHSETNFKCGTELSVHPHYDQCSKYYLCQNGKKYIDTCPKNERFDSLSLKCVEKSKAVCAVRPTTESPVTTPGVFDCGVQHGNFFHEQLCDRYYECYNWLPYEKTCSEGRLFDQSTKQCLEASKADCGTRVRPTMADFTTGVTENVFRCPGRAGVYFHGERCELYYECINFLPYIKRCPEETLFDEYNKTCLPEVRTYCGDRTRPDGASPQEPETTTAMEEGTTEDATTTSRTTTTEGTTTSPQEETTTPQPTTIPTTTIRTTTTKRTTTTTDDDSGEFEDIECPEPNGLFPHPKDRHKYIVCQLNTAMVLSCPADLVFDPIKKVCVWQN